MKFTINGFNQEKLLAFNLDNDDSLILRWFIDFKDTGKMYSEIINDDKFYWLKYDALIEDIPILKIKKDTLYRKLKFMADKGILKRYTKKEKGTFSFYSIGEKYVELIDGYGKKSVGGTDLNPEGYGKKSVTNNQSTNNQSIINNQSTKDSLNNITAQKIERVHYKNKNEALKDIYKKCEIEDNKIKYVIIYFINHLLEKLGYNHYVIDDEQAKTIQKGFDFLLKIDCDIDLVLEEYFKCNGYKTLYGMLEPKMINYILFKTGILDSNNCYDEEGNIKEYFDI